MQSQPFLNKRKLLQKVLLFRPFFGCLARLFLCLILSKSKACRILYTYDYVQSCVVCTNKHDISQHLVILKLASWMTVAKCTHKMGWCWLSYRNVQIWYTGGVLWRKRKFLKKILPGSSGYNRNCRRKLLYHTASGYPLDPAFTTLYWLRLTILLHSYSNRSYNICICRIQIRIQSAAGLKTFSIFSLVLACYCLLSACFLPAFYWIDNQIVIFFCLQNWYCHYFCRWLLEARC